MITKLNYLALASLFVLLLTFLGSAEEAAVEGEAPLDRPHALQFRTYDLDWVRFRNMDTDGELKLSAAESVVFPFQRYNNGNVALGMSELQAPGAIAELIAVHEIAYDETAVVGNCDPNKLAPGSSDIYCVPGTRGMEPGHIFLALFDPDSHELAALTTTIYNTLGIALRPKSQPTPSESENNNCCFLSWRCSTDWQWTNGYWAFQNNQCSGPEHAAQPQIQQRQTSESRQSSQTSESRQSSQSSQSSDSRQSSPSNQSSQSSSETETTATCQSSCCNEICCWMQKVGGKWRWHCE